MDFIVVLTLRGVEKGGNSLAKFSFGHEFSNIN
jgi:hypothetical protein